MEKKGVRIVFNGNIPELLTLYGIPSWGNPSGKSNKRHRFRLRKYGKFRKFPEKIIKEYRSERYPFYHQVIEQIIEAQAADGFHYVQLLLPFYRQKRKRWRA